MNRFTTSDARRRKPFVPALIALAALGILGWGTAALAAPPAGTTIGNQATATYLDASNTSRTVTSNLVTTIVQQIASFTLIANGNVTAAPGGQATFPHTLTNTGNGTDTFPLTLVNLAGDNFDLTGLAIYADANGDGVPDNFVPLVTTGALAAGASFRFVVVGNVPGVQVGGDIARVRISSASTFDNTQTAFDTDVVTVTGNAVVSVTKAISSNSGASPSGPYTYTLTYNNTGNSTATAVKLTDVIPAGMTYVPGSARWSTTGATVLTDLNNADAQGIAPNTVVYDFGVTAAGTATATIARIAAGGSGTLTFQVNVNAGLGPQTINNTSTYSYNDGAANVGPFTTNVAPFTIGTTVALTFAGQTVASATQGATITYTNVLTNNGNGPDVFNITMGASTFPAGTTFTLYHSDGVTPLTDSNADGTPDTGPVAAGATYNVILKAQLPPGVNGGPYQVIKIATSVADPTKNAQATDVLTAIVTSTVDLTNNAALPGAPGAGAGPEAAAVVTNATNPGTTTRITLYVNNTSGVNDAYALTASTDPTFAAVTLPAGWSVTFRDGLNNVITTTAPIAAGGNSLVYADVTVPAGYTAGTSDLYFRALSPVSTAMDRIHDAVTVNAQRALTVTPNNSAQVAPGGSVVYTHLIINNGNVAEGTGVGSTVTLARADNQVGWNSTIHVDTNNNGVLDAGDAPISDLATIGGLAPGASVRVFVTVFAPAGAPLGQVDATTLTATTANGTYVSAVPAPANATDNTTVINGQLAAVKMQAIDADCNGIPDGLYTLLNITAGAIPGACLRYQITVTNNGTAPVTNVVVNDDTPPNTTYSATVPASTTVGSVVAPANGAAGTITATVGVLGPGQSVVVTFGIRINP
jgi:trimeric autotransporter adhesin